MYRVYVSGPMSGYAEYNFPAFMEAAQELRHRGFVVINPAELNIDHDVRQSDYAACLTIALQGLLLCNAIYLLPGWEKSRGAVLELRIAAALGFVCVDDDLVYPTSALTDLLDLV